MLAEGSGELWRTRNDDAWMDPTDPVSFEYPVALAEEACRAGFAKCTSDPQCIPSTPDSRVAKVAPATLLTYTVSTLRGRRDVSVPSPSSRILCIAMCPVL